MKVGTLTTTGGGGGRARFRTRPRGDHQLLGFDPRGAMVIVRNAAGEDVLTGTVPDQTGSDEIACCTTRDHGDHEGEVECEDRTADECTAADECANEGGIVVMATSCDPNPCSPTPAAPEIVCCVPGDGQPHRDHAQVGPECEVITADRCTARNGTQSTATSCDPDPCAQAGPGEVVCCVPHPEDPGAGAKCEIVTADDCTATQWNPEHRDVLQPRSLPALIRGDG